MTLHESDDDALVPAKLAEALSRAYSPAAGVPPEVDEAVLWAARQHFTRQHRRRLMVRWGGVSAVAAALIVAVGLAIHPPGAGPQPTVALRGDLNHDGRVDIVDAFLLAKALDAHMPMPEADFYHDGVVDQRDVQRLAQAAVSLKPVTLQ